MKRPRPIVVVTGALTVLLGVVAYHSLFKPLVIDSAYFHYYSYLVNETGRIPYRDVYDINMPGSIFFHLVLTKLLGYSDAAAHAVDLAILAALGVTTAMILRPFEAVARWLGAMIYPLVYFGAGPATALQRDHLIILPVAIAIAITLREPWRARPWLRYALVGFVLGCAATMRPESSLLALVLIAFERRRQRDGAPRLPIHLAVTAVAGALPLLVLLVWLASIGALGDFVENIAGFWPLRVSPFSEQGLRTIRNHFGDYLRAYGVWPLLAIPGLLGAYRMFSTPQPNSDRRDALALAGAVGMLWGALMLFSGRFGEALYSWQLPGFALALSAATCADGGLGAGTRRFERIMPATVLFAVLIAYSFRPPDRFDKPSYFALPPNNISAQIARFVEQETSADEEIQLWECRGSPTRAALLTKRPHATRFISSAQFRFYVGNPYVRQLQDEFLEELAETKPALFIWGTDCDKARDTAAREKPFDDEIRAVLKDNGYRIAAQRDGFTIYQPPPAG